MSGFVRCFLRRTAAALAVAAISVILLPGTASAGDGPQAMDTLDRIHIGIGGVLVLALLIWGGSRLLAKRRRRGPGGSSGDGHR
jgi:hypothetical protein